jgi:hypothetical protein
LNKEPNTASVDEIKISAENNYQAKVGEKLIVVLKATSALNLVISEDVLPDGSILLEQKKDGSAERIFTWTPTSEAVSQSPHLLSYIVSAENGDVVLHAISIGVTN